MIRTFSIHRYSADYPSESKLQHVDGFSIEIHTREDAGDTDCLLQSEHRVGYHPTYLKF
jgi:hypothetical protein